MKFTIIAYYDKQLESFTSPQAINSSSAEDIKTDVSRGILKQLPKEKIGVFAKRKLYKLGYYDDATGIISDAVPEELVDCDLLLAQRIKTEKELKEVTDYVGGKVAN